MLQNAIILHLNYNSLGSAASLCYYQVVKFRFELTDRPTVVARVTGKLAYEGFWVKDISYTIVDTDSGDAVCTIVTDLHRYPANHLAKAKKIENDINDWIASSRLPAAYERWFRRPSIVLSFVTQDRVGLVHSVLTEINTKLTQHSPTAAGNVLDLKGFNVDDQQLFALTMQVAVRDSATQAKLIETFVEWCATHDALDFDVRFDNFIHDYINGAGSDAS